MPGFHWPLRTVPAIPVWLQIFLRVFSFVEPQYEWLAEVLVLAYGVLQQLPWLHRAPALKELRVAVDSAKTAKARGSDDPCGQLRAWCDLWHRHLPLKAG